MTYTATTTRFATGGDARRLAALHAARISEGFLPSLGPRFLTRLYARIARSEGAFAVVAEDDTRVVGFVAAAQDVGRLYREFLVRDGIAAGLLAAPHLLRSWRRVVDVLRYPSSTAGLPDAEILAVAVDEPQTGRGLGAMLVHLATEELERRGTRSAKVVAGAHNEAALQLYRRCGFQRESAISVHGEVRSEVLVWTAP